MLHTLDLVFEVQAETKTKSCCRFYMGALSQVTLASRPVRCLASLHQKKRCAEGTKVHAVGIKQL